MNPLLMWVSAAGLVWGIGWLMCASLRNPFDWDHFTYEANGPLETK